MHVINAVPSSCPLSWRFNVRLSTRKGFLAAAASTALLGAAPPSPPPATPSPNPTPKASELARAFAERMRQFDPKLSDKDLETIAGGIEDNLKTGARVNPKGRALKNWDEPVTVFEVEG